MQKNEYFLTKINHLELAFCHQVVDFPCILFSQRFDDKGEVIVLVGEHVLLARPGTP